MKTKATVYDFKAVKAKHRPTMPYKITLYIGQSMYRKNLLFQTLLSWFSYRPYRWIDQVAKWFWEGGTRSRMSCQDLY